MPSHYDDESGISLDDEASDQEVEVSRDQVKNTQEFDEEEEYGFEEEEEEDLKASGKRKRKSPHVDSKQKKRAKISSDEENADDEEGNQDNNDAGDGKDLFEDIFGSASDEEEDIKRQLESAGADDLISRDQRGLQHRRYFMPEFPVPNIDEDLVIMKPPTTLTVLENRFTENDIIEQDQTQAIRWRYKVDRNGEHVQDDFGQPVVESNAKIVKWSDDSYYLYIGGTRPDGSDTVVYEISSSRLHDPSINQHLYVSSKQSSCSFDIGKISNAFSLQLISQPTVVQKPHRAIVAEEAKRTIRITKGKVPKESETERQIRDMKKKIKSKQKKHEDGFGTLNIDFLEEGMEEEETTVRKRGKKPSKSKSRTARRLADIEIEDDYEEEDLDEYEEDVSEEEEYEVQEESDDDYEYKPKNKRR